jgi:hypothetical protein
MELKFALLADWAGETREGKLVISGEFDLITAANAPAVHPSLFLVARLHANVAEGSSHKLDLRLIGPTQQEHQRLKDFPVKFSPGGPGRPLRGQLLVKISPLNLPRFGKYHIEIRIDNRLMDTVPFELRRTERA